MGGLLSDQIMISVVFKHQIRIKGKSGTRTASTASLFHAHCASLFSNQQDEEHSQETTRLLQKISQLSKKFAGTTGEISRSRFFPSFLPDSNQILWISFVKMSEGGVVAHSIGPLLHKFLFKTTRPRVSCIRRWTSRKESCRALVHFPLHAASTPRDGRSAPIPAHPLNKCSKKSYYPSHRDRRRSR